MDVNPTTAQQRAEWTAQNTRSTPGADAPLVSVTQSATGQRPTQTFAVTFAYADGKMRKFDGKSWTTQG